MVEAVVFFSNLVDNLNPQTLGAVVIGLGAIMVLLCLWQWRENRLLGQREELRARAAQQYARTLEEYIGALSRIFEHRIAAEGADWRGSEQADFKVAHAVLRERIKGATQRYYGK